MKKYLSLVAIITVMNLSAIIEEATSSLNEQATIADEIVIVEEKVALVQPETTTNLEEVAQK